MASEPSHARAAAGVVCFGEVLWDVLPHGRFLGGAPLNVAYHLARLGVSPRIVSAVGADALGRETRSAIEAAGLSCDALGEVAELSTGTVAVTLRDGHASYRIEEPVAWDRIRVRPKEGEATPRVLVHGTLALRSEINRAALGAWMATRPCWRVCDLNLRRPHDALGALAPYVHGAQVLKVNEEELARVAGAVGCRSVDVAERAAAVAEHWSCVAVCVTLGEAGALVWQAGRVFRAAAPPVVVRDTIGAGDAFTAALVAGLCETASVAVDWEPLLRRACALGAFVASRDGAQPSYAASDVPGL